MLLPLVWHVFVQRHVYRRVQSGSNPTSPPPPDPGFVGLRLTCGGGSRFFGWLARRARNKEDNTPRVFFLLVGPPRTEQKKKGAPCFFLGRPAAHGAKKKRAPCFFLVGPPRTEQKSVIYKKAHRTKKKHSYPQRAHILRLLGPKTLSQRVRIPKY